MDTKKANRINGLPQMSEKGRESPGVIHRLSTGHDLSRLIHRLSTGCPTTYTQAVTRTNIRSDLTDLPIVNQNIVKPKSTRIVTTVT